MGAPVKSRRRKCRICDNWFTTSILWAVVCDECVAKLPKCQSCHAVMAPEYGYSASFAMKVGKKKICWSCKRELEEKGSLHISQSRDLNSSGHVSAASVPEDNKGVTQILKNRI